MFNRRLFRAWPSVRLRAWAALAERECWMESDLPYLVQPFWPSVYPALPCQTGDSELELLQRLARKESAALGLGNECKPKVLGLPSLVNKAYGRVPS